MNNKKMHHFIYFIIGVTFLSAQFHLSNRDSKPSLVVTKQQSAVLLNDEFLKYFNLGQSRLLSSLIWVETLMESDLEHYKHDDLNSWMFLRFSTLTKIDPYFYEVYKYGGIYLSIVKDDAAGANEIYARGLKVFPNDSELYKNYAFNSYFELNNIENAIWGYENALKHSQYLKEKSFIPSLLQKLKTEKSGVVTEETYQALLSQYNYLDDKQKKTSRVTYSLYAVRAELDLKCLNKKMNENCNRRDFHGDLYIKKDGKYISKKSFKSFRLKKRKLK